MLKLQVVLHCKQLCGKQKIQAFPLQYTHADLCCFGRRVSYVFKTKRSLIKVHQDFEMTK